MRRRLMLMAALLVAAVAGCGASNDAPSKTSASNAKISNGDLGLADPSIIGMSANDLEKQFDLIDASGATSVRTDLFWRVIEKKPGKYDWSKFDVLVDAANKHNKSVLAVLGYAPSWAGKKGCTDGGLSRCAPKRVSDFKKFVTRAVARYSKRGVHRYEIWNEPNLRPRFWPAPNPAFYAQLVRRTCPVIKKLDRKAVVVVSGLGLGDKPGDIPMQEFAERFYNAKPGKCWDAFGIHLYNTGSLGRADQLHALMEEHGDGHKSIWMTEVGFASEGACGAKNNDSEKQQASRLTEFVNDWRRKPWAGPLYWFITKDVPAAGNRFGLVCSKGAKKPALEAFRSLARAN